MSSPAISARRVRYWPRAKRIGPRQARRHGEGERNRVRGFPADVGDGQSVKARRGHLPSRPGIGALQKLQLGEQITEMFCMPAAPAACLHPAVGGSRERRLGENGIDGRVPNRPARRRVGRDPLRDQSSPFHRTRTIRRCTATARRAPPGRGGGFPRCRRRAAPATRRRGANDSPPRAAPRRRCRRGSDRASRSSGARTARYRRHREIAGRWSPRNRRSAARPAAGCGRRRIAQIGQRILVAALAFERTGIVVKPPRLADQIEPDIGERQLLFEQRRMSAPFRQPVAEDQRVVSQPQYVIEERHHRPGARASRPPSAVERSGADARDPDLPRPSHVPTSFGTV